MFVGEIIGGGVNFGGGFNINFDLIVFILMGVVVNLVIGINWEGVGVVFEVKISVEDVLDKVLELVKVEVKVYWNKRIFYGKDFLLGMVKLFNKVDVNID